MKYMRFNSLITFVFLLAFLISLPSFSLADKKKYVWTAEYHTMAAGEAELEHYFDLSVSDYDKFTGNTAVKQQFEFEVGMNDHWDMRFYQSFSQKPGEDFRYDGFKVETRYRLGEKDSYFVDQLLYFEYKNKPDFSRHVLEFKYVMSKDFGRFNITAQPVFEIGEGGEGEDTQFDVRYSIGASYEANDLLAMGMEFRGGEKGHYIGPTLSHGNDFFWMASGVLWGYNLDAGQSEFKIRTIFGFHF